MILFAIAAVLSSSASYSKMTPDQQQVVGANSGDLDSYEYQYVWGDTRRIKPQSEKAIKVAAKAKPKAKRLVTFIPQGNGLAHIIAKIKRENGIKSKS